MASLSAQKLRRFFEDFSQLRYGKGGAEQYLQINYHSLENFLKIFSSLQQGCEPAGTKMNIFDICRLGREEIRNCSVLAWLLDGNGSHGLGDAFLRGILQKCGLHSIASQQLAGKYSTRTEYCPNGDQTDRVDIVCEGQNFLLYFEVKIDAQEHAEQTERYYEKLKNNRGAREGAMIFISTGSLPVNRKAHFLSWRDCALILDDLAFTNINAPSLASILRQYADFIRRF